MPRAKRNLSIQAKNRIVASWIFGGLLVVFILWAYAFGPEELPPAKHNLLGFTCAIVAGLFGFFFTGSMKLTLERNLSQWGKLGVQSGGGAALFVFVLLWWTLGGTPISMKVTYKLDEIVRLLESALRIQQEQLLTKDGQISFLENQITSLERQKPSQRARDLAAQIPDDAEGYALALKAIAEERYDEARKILDRALEDEEQAIARIFKLFMARAKPEYYEGKYLLAAGWYRKALALGTEDSIDLAEIALGLHGAGQYELAGPLYKRALEIREKALGPEHPDVGASLNNLASLYHAQGRYDEAEPLYKRALEIREKAVGPEHPDVGASLNNLALLYRDQGRYNEAEPLQKRALEICEKAVGPEHPDVGTSLSNLALLYRDQDRYNEAEPLYKRALEIGEKTLGPEHPSVGGTLWGLADLCRKRGQKTQAGDYYRQALKIFEAKLGREHPRTKTLRQQFESFKSESG